MSIGANTSQIEGSSSGVDVSSNLLEEDQKQLALWFENEYQGQDAQKLRKYLIEAKEDLDVSGFDLLSLPALKKFTNLKSIVLPTQTLTLSDIVGPFTLFDIAQLTLWQNEKVDENEQRKEACKRIKEVAQKNQKVLNLSFLGLSKLPSHIGKLTQVEVCIFSFNQLSTLPKEIGELESLERLNLYGNQFQVLPEQIRKLSKLQNLNLYKNRLTTLPNWMGELRELRELYLSTNLFTECPKEIKELRYLEKLDFSYNQIRILPDWIGRLKSLEKLNFAHNNLMTIPDRIEELEHVQVLNFSYNKVTVFPDCIRVLQHIKRLNFAHNQLIILPNWIGEFGNLEYLNLIANQLSGVPSSFFDLPVGCRVFLENNHFSREESERIQASSEDRFTVYISIQEDPATFTSPTGA